MQMALMLLGFGVLFDFHAEYQRIKWLTLLILAMFAFKSWLRRPDVWHPDGDSEFAR